MLLKLAKEVSCILSCWIVLSSWRRLHHVYYKKGAIAKYNNTARKPTRPNHSRIHSTARRRKKLDRK
ncbi:hypothetical protein C2E23DRAFT_73604 [Lenzites betulinus]|nr:hypothetical protein C2E23DRAFT_73604 [Lenzites betulinus]